MQNRINDSAHFYRMNTQLRATGTRSIVMGMSLRQFVPTTGGCRLPRQLQRLLPHRLSPTERFEQVRGSGEYAAWLRKLGLTRWFEIDQDEARIERYSHKFGTVVANPD